jgi:t-SNARE complex subunit (syntaxin)
MEQRELNQLLEKSKKILAMSNDIKKITEENNNLLSHTSTNFDTIENNLINGNEELKKLEAEKVLRNKRYFWIGGGLFIIIIIVIVFIYVKYNTPSKSKNNV